MASKTTMTLSEAEHGGRVNAGYVNDDTLYEIELTDKTTPSAEEPPGSISIENEARCGWCFLRPKFLQRFRTAKWALFSLCWAGALQGMVVNGFVNVVITTIERRFGMRSSETGLIASGYDVASFLCLVPVTYFGGHEAASKPRWIGWGVVVLGIGALVFASPHLMAPPYRGDQHQDNTCLAMAQLQKEIDANNTILKIEGFSQDCEKEGGSSMRGDVSVYMWVFFFGQLLHGAGSSPLYTLGVTFIDENVSKKMSSVYIAIFYTTSIIGPALGYVLGGEFLKIYTDFLVTDSDKLGLTPASNVWVGAWWVGFVFAALACFILAVPLLAFPPALPGSAALRAAKVSEAHASSPEVPSLGKLRAFPKLVLALLANPAFLCLNLAGASEGLLIAGFAAFLPKLIENQFSVSASQAALLMGVVTVPAGGGGTFLGGYLVKRFRLHCAGIIKLCLLATVLSFLSALCFMLTCPEIAFAGVTKEYLSAPLYDNETFYSNVYRVSLESPCNSACQCDTKYFDPICGADHVMYYSPCHAGCNQVDILGNINIYSNCTCIDSPEPLSDWLSSVNEMQIPSLTEAIGQNCPTRCTLLWPFVGMAFLVMFFTFLATMPALSATLRCVRDEQRSFALGIQWIKVRLLGTIPAPMVIGFLIDRTCLLWHKTSSLSSDCTDIDTGACQLYHNREMGRNMLIIALVGKLVSVLFFSLAWRFYRAPTIAAKSDAEDRPTSESRVANQVY